MNSDIKIYVSPEFAPVQKMWHAMDISVPMDIGGLDMRLDTAIASGTRLYLVAMSNQVIHLAAMWQSKDLLSETPVMVAADQDILKVITSRMKTMFDNNDFTTDMLYVPASLATPAHHRPS